MLSLNVTEDAHSLIAQSIWFGDEVHLFVHCG